MLRLGQAVGPLLLAGALALPISGCGLRLDAGRLREVAENPGGAAGAAADVPLAGGWSQPDLARLGFVLLGDAKLRPDGVGLTTDGPIGETGGIALRDPVQLGMAPQLNVSLVFHIDSTLPSGEGLAIVLHSSASGETALGKGREALGYGGLAPCIALEVDVASGSAGEPSTPHLAFVPGCNSEQASRLTPIAGDPTNGSGWRLSLRWDFDSTLLEARLSPERTGPPATVLSEAIDLTTLLGEKCFVAVTAATGELRANQWLTNLQVVGAGIGSRTIN